jgi:hypothetical protein
MTTAKALETARSIRALIGKSNIEDAIVELLAYFSEIGDKNCLNDVVALQARLYGLNQAITRGTISEQEAAIQRGRICSSILLMLDVIVPEAARPEPAKSVKKGKLLHNIPDAMKVGEVVECRVRIATTEKQLRKNFASADHIATIPLDRIGERMEVRLEAADAEAFIIKRQNRHALQIIEPDVHTEWVFDIIPMKDGVHLLFLKVEIILETKNGDVRRDEVISVPVDVSSTRPTSAAQWNNVADISTAGASKGFFTQIVSSVFGKKKGEVKRLSAALIVIIAGYVIAQMIWSERQETSFSLTGARNVGIIIEAPADNIAEAFTVSGKAFPLKKVKQGIWQTRIDIPDKQIYHRIYFQGDVSGGNYRNSYLDKAVNTFYFTDTSRCGLYIEVDTVVQPLSHWYLVWEKSPTQFESFRVEPIDDQMFFVPLGDWCAAMFMPGKKYNFQLINDSLTLWAKEVPVSNPPFRILFTYEPTIAGPVTYNTTATLIFSRPIALNSISVNGQRVAKYTSFDATGAPRKKAGAQFVIDAGNVRNLDPSTSSFTFTVSSSDCTCAAKTVAANTNIRETITCTPNPAKTPSKLADPTPVQHGPPAITRLPKTKIADLYMQLPPKWAKQIKDLSITVDGKPYSSSLPLVDGKIPFNLAVRDENCSICIEMHGQNTGTPLTLGCYVGPIEPKMDLEILDGKIVRK